MRPKTDFTPLPELTAELEAKYFKKTASGEKSEKGEKPKLVPFFAAIRPSTLDAAGDPPQVVELAPAARERTHTGGTHATASEPITTDGAAAPTPRRTHKRRAHRKNTVTGAYNSVPSLSKVVSGKY